ncbi:hypothetical protein BC628DRAFT_1422514 [Trametes gibbosa]|nr:hypothetical protein BC628DRAFT_1422514 [Trametes gibbosa]
MVTSTNVTIDDSSSLILYDPPDAWASPSGNNAQAYANSTYHGTSISGATAKLTFNGTGVWLYGATRPDYGSFILVVDDEVSAYSNATTAEPAFGQILGGASNLDMGMHVVSIMNAGSGPIDLDGIVYETVNQSQQNVPPSAGTSSGQSSSTSTPNSASTQSARVSAKPHASGGPGNGDSGDGLSDPEPPPSASPTATPNTTPGDVLPTTHGGSGEETTSPQETPSATPTRVAVTPPAVLSSSASTDANGSLATIDPNQPPGQAQRDSKPTVSGTASQPKGGLPKAAVIGIIVGCAVLLLLIAVLVFMLLRRRRRAKHARRKTGLPSPILPLQDPEQNFGYFVRGQGAMAEKRAYYLDESQFRTSQASDDSAETVGKYGGPYREQDITAMPTPLPPVFVRDSSYTAETTTLHGDDDGSDIADLYSRMDAGPPVRPSRPPELRLSV